MKQRTLVLIKPDAVRRGLIGSIITRFENEQLFLRAVNLKIVNRHLAESHYVQHKGKHFYDRLIASLIGYEVIALMYEGEDIIQKIRKLVGDTNPEKALSNTIRGMFGRVTSDGIIENVVHASANPEEAKYEIKLWFGEDK